MTATEKNEQETPANAPETALSAEEALLSDADSLSFDEEGDSVYEKQILALEAEVANLKEALQRQLAETENVRRRGEKDKQDAGSYAVTAFARDILGLADNMRRTLELVTPEVAEVAKVFLDGVEMTERELLSSFERHGIRRITPEIGEKFDPSRHQALFEVPTDKEPSGLVMQVVGAGYVIKDRLLRPAMVGVSKSSAASAGLDTKA